MKRQFAEKRRGSRHGFKPKPKLGKDAFDWSNTGEGDVIHSDSEGSDEDSNLVEEGGEEDDEEDKETADEKRIRLAKEYLETLHEDEDGDEEEDGEEEDKISKKLMKDAMESSGKLFKQVAQSLTAFEFDCDSSRLYRGHKRPVTCVTLLEDESSAFTAAKDGTILRWDIQNGCSKIPLRFPKEDEIHSKKDHEKCILSLCASSDGKYLASGGFDRTVRVWDLRSNELIETFKGHRDTVSSVVFRLKSTSLFSGSYDRTIKHWNLTEMGYVESLFGHQSQINALDCLHKEKVVSCGSDNTIRVWKIAEDSQLVFNGKAGSIDSVAMLNDEFYCSGSDTGMLSLWNNQKKKPVFLQENAHGKDQWISSLASLRTTDLLASGSSDGWIRLWKADLETRTLEQVGEIPVEGFVNGIAFAKSGRFVAAAIGQEHRMGRWSVNKNAANGLHITPLPSIDLNH